VAPEIRLVDDHCLRGQRVGSWQLICPDRWPPNDIVVIRRDGKGHLLEARMWLQRRRAEIFPFFADASNLEAITPDWLHFSVVTPPPIAMAAGAVIEYRLRLHGAPLRWRTLISEWDPPRCFVDRQLAGPYSRWVHEHRFVEIGGGVLVADRVRYRIRGGRVLDRVANAAVAEPDLQRIFTHRQRTLRALL
jgi:ligand-binding SRPBCC domain-containing protein